MVARFGRRMRCAALVMLLLTGCNGGDPDQSEPSASPSAATAVSSAAPSQSPSQAPRGETYTVEAGDTLSEIARRFDTTVEALVEANDIDDPDVLDIGDELVVPRER